MRKIVIGALFLALAIAPLAVAGDSAAKALVKWKAHTGDLPFIVGYEKGKKEAEFSGRPMMLFFTTTW